MPPSKRTRVAEARPVVESVIEQLRSDGAASDADAVQTVLDVALEATASGKTSVTYSSSGQPNMAIPIDSALHLRVYDRSSNLTADVLEGWQRFLEGKWKPKEPKRAPLGKGKAKSVLNVRAPAEYVARVEAAADRMVAEMGWSTKRGYKLNARQIAVQWLARKYPEARAKAPAVETEGE